MKGTVTISLEDYESLKAAEDKAKQLIDSKKTASKELQVFFTFLCTREAIEPFVEEFNRQSKTAKILLQDNKATIEFNDDQDKV